MRHIPARTSLMFVLPLAACFDAEMTLRLPDQNNAEATVVRTASAEFFEMPMAAAEAFCDDGVETALADGSRSCTSTYTGTIDEVVNDPEISQGMSIERRDGGMLFVSINLADVTSDIAPPEEAGGEEMLAMMAASFQGHTITMNVAGSEVVETNGSVSADGKMASYVIPLDAMVTGTAELPESFDVLLLPGS